jgi:hypothetical protein
LGEFDLALQDYLLKRDEFDLSPPIDLDMIDFGQGFILGAANGVSGAMIEFLPNALSSLQGLSHLIWSTLNHPIQAPQQMLKASLEFCEFLRTADKEELAKICVPELHDLVTHWDQLDNKNRGELLGYALGNYGVDILAPVAALKGIKYVTAYRQIQNAEKLCVLEALSRSQTKAEMLEMSAKWQGNRKLQLSSLKIEMDKQGKHLVGHRNYDPDMRRAIWNHPNPQSFVDKLAGTGKRGYGTPGIAGYKEIVDCGEIIGYFVEEKTGIQIPTTMAKIHYSKKGVHIVPARPKK